MSELPVRKPQSFESAISTNPLSVYIGRIVYMPSSWKENGLVYVDVNDISGDIRKGTHGDDEGEELMKELESFGYRKAMLPRSFVMAANLWENPQAIYYKGSFAGNGSISISNYMFDPLTMTWITTVSTALNAIGIVNVPPVLVSLSETGIPSPPSSVDVGQLVDETFSDALNSMTDPLEPGNTEDSLIPSIDASDIVNDIKDMMMESVGKALTSGGGAVKDMLSNGINTVSSLIPNLKGMYGYDDIINRRDVLHEAITKGEALIVRKVEALERSAKEQANALMATAKDSVERAKQMIEGIIMGVVSPIVTRITSMFNEIVSSLREKLVNVIETKLKAPIRKVKKKLVRIVSQTVTPMLEKLPMPVRYIATIVIKNVLKPLIKKLIGFIIDAVKGVLKTAFKFGKDAIVKILKEAFSGMKDTFMSSFSERSALQMESKTEWIMTTELGDTIKALPDAIKPYMDDMDTVYEAVSENLSPSSSEMASYTSSLSGLLSATYDGLSIMNKPSDDEYVYVDGIRNRRVSIYDAQFSRFSQSSNFHFGSDSLSKFFYTKTVEWLTKRLVVLSSYANTLDNPGKKPSEIVTESLKSFPDGAIMSTTDRETVMATLMKSVTDSLSGSLEYARGLDEDIMWYVCRMLGIERSSVQFMKTGDDMDGLPYISPKDPWVPQWDVKEYVETRYTTSRNGSRIPHHSYSYTAYSDELGKSETVKDSTIYKLAEKSSDLIASYISELLASLHSLVNGGVMYSKVGDNAYEAAPLTDRDMNIVYRYRENADSFVCVDNDTGYVYQICPVFNVSPREFTFNGNKKKKDRVSYADGYALNWVSIYDLVNASCVDAYRKLYPDEYHSSIPVTQEQLDLLSKWRVYQYYAYLHKEHKPVFDKNVYDISFELCSMDENPRGVRIYVQVGDKKITLDSGELLYTICNSSPSYEKNGFLRAEGLRYACTYIYDDKGQNDDTVPLSLFLCKPSSDKDKHGNVTKYEYRVRKGVSVLQSDGSYNTEKLWVKAEVDVSSVTVLCDKITWYTDELSDGVDVSAFFYLAPAIFSESTPTPKCVPLVPQDTDSKTDISSLAPDGILPRIRTWKDITASKDTPTVHGSQASYVVHRACNELVFISIDGGKDKITERAQLKNNEVRDIFVARTLYRSSFSEMKELEAESNSYASAEDTSTSEEISVTDGTKQRVYDRIMSRLPDLIKGTIAASSAASILSESDIEGITHEVMTSAVEVLPTAVSDALLGIDLSEEGMKSLTKGLMDRAVESLPSTLVSYGIGAAAASAVSGSLVTTALSSMPDTVKSALSSVNMGGDWSKSWDGIEKKAGEVMASIKESMPDSLTSALSSVDFTHLGKIEPLLSDAQQVVMDRLVGFMNDAEFDLSDITSEFTDSVKQMMAKIGEVASKAVDIQGIIDKVSDAMKIAKGANDVIETISKLGDVGQKLSDTFDSLSGGLDTSLVSSLGAMIGPSMSISSSIGEYDMNLTEKPKCMKPYCYEMEDKSILKVGDIVLMMAVGNSTDHLYIIELPYKGQIV